MSPNADMSMVKRHKRRQSNRKSLVHLYRRREAYDRSGVSCTGACYVRTARHRKRQFETREAFALVARKKSVKAKTKAHDDEPRKGENLKGEKQSQPSRICSALRDARLTARCFASYACFSSSIVVCHPVVDYSSTLSCSSIFGKCYNFLLDLLNLPMQDVCLSYFFTQQ